MTKIQQHKINLGAFMLFVVLAPFSHNLGKVAVLDFMQGFGLAATITFLLFGFARIFASNSGRASLIATAHLFIFFGYQGAWYLVEHLCDYMRWTLPKEDVFLGFYVIAFAIPILLLRNWPRDLHSTGIVMSTVALVMLIQPIFTIGQYVLRGGQFDRSEIADSAVPMLYPNSTGTKASPNIVMLIFDRYANEHVLTEQFNFDNKQFLNALVRRGFYVATESRSNYLRTAHSLAATLSLNYLQNSTDLNGTHSRDYLSIYNQIHFPIVARALQSVGYKFLHFGSWWGPTRALPGADENINLATLPEFITLLYTNSLLDPLDRRLGFYFFSSESQCRRVPFKLMALRERLTDDDGPIFAFAHFLLPHKPYVFDSDGKCVVGTSRKSSYLDQLQYANKEMLAFIDALRALTSRPTIIVLQSDEGPYPERFANNVRSFDWTSASDDELRMKTGILNAFYFPDRDYREFTKDLTPVNTFRLIFNKYFGTTFPLLPNNTFIHPNESEIYNFHEVTDNVRWSHD